jgi:hypothetical protein
MGIRPILNAKYNTHLQPLQCPKIKLRFKVFSTDVTNEKCYLD